MKISNSILSFSVFVGTCIGVGIFSLPYVAMKSGMFLFTAIFVFLFLAVLLLHYVFADICLNTQGNHYLSGYVEKYLGKKWGAFAFLVDSGLIVGSLLVYLILGGQFLYRIFGLIFGGGYIHYSFFIFFVGALLVFFGIKSISFTELLMSLLLVLVFIIFFVSGLPMVNAQNYAFADINNVFLPYGAIFFSLMAIGTVPEIKEMMGKNKVQILSIITKGLIFSGFICLVFAYLVVGISGSGTTKEAIFGLSALLPESVVTLIYLFAFLSIFTSYINISLLFKKILHVDRKVPKNYAWAIAIFLPIFLLLLGFNNFIVIIGFVGSVFMGIIGIFLFATYLKMIKNKTIKFEGIFIRRAGIYLLMAVFFIGVIIELIVSVMDWSD